MHTVVYRNGALTIAYFENNAVNWHVGCSTTVRVASVIAAASAIFSHSPSTKASSSSIKKKYRNVTAALKALHHDSSGICRCAEVSRKKKDIYVDDWQQPEAARRDVFFSPSPSSRPLTSILHVTCRPHLPPRLAGCKTNIT